MKAAICVIAYNRVQEFKRLIRCLEQSKLNFHSDLIISIDYSSTQHQIINAAKNIKWFHGEVVIIDHRTNLGLKKHVISCGDLSENYDFFVLLEDDLILSPFFNDYLTKAVACSEKDESIAGISLYNYTKNEDDKVIFEPLIDNNDCYFVQYPSSWGFAVTREQWISFKKWLKINDCDMFIDNSLPEYVCKWPASSWKKHFIRYLVHENKYFMYPRFSLVTNPGSDGTHHNNINSLYSIPLCLSPRDWRLCVTSKSIALYDVNFEHISSEKLLKEFSFLYDNFSSLGTLVRQDKVNSIFHNSYLSFNDVLRLNLKTIPHVFNKAVYKFRSLIK